MHERARQVPAIPPRTGAAGRGRAAHRAWCTPYTRSPPRGAGDARRGEHRLLHPVGARQGDPPERRGAGVAGTRPPARRPGDRASACAGRDGRPRPERTVMLSHAHGPQECGAAGRVGAAEPVVRRQPDQRPARLEPRRDRAVPGPRGLAGASPQPDPVRVPAPGGTDAVGGLGRAGRRQCGRAPGDGRRGSGRPRPHRAGGGAGDEERGLRPAVGAVRGPPAQRRAEAPSSTRSSAG